MEKFRKQEALDYHKLGRKGKIEVIPTKPTSTQKDLSLAYSPGVAEPCREIEKDVEEVYNYTAKGNLVAVISNGTAVLGLGNIGPEASKPVMEGKGLLFKIFADIDVFDIEIDAEDPEKFIQTVKAISPTFGGINLEDIKAPEAFEIERRLKEELNIPVMHDDQHGTAIISGAALLNAIELSDKKIGEIKVVISGAGAAAVSCTSLFIALGVKRKNIVMLDSKGVIRKDRKDLSESKINFATDRDIYTLEEAMVNADVFLGLSVANVVSKQMVKSMNVNPVVFALANPDPEISYEKAKSVRKDLIMATGRSDNPNQVNNVLGFPYIFRGALDVRASKINEEMKLAAVKAIAELAKKPIPEEVNIVFSSKKIVFGKDYIIPKPLDHRLLWEVSMAVAKAAMDSGVARKPISDWDAYKEELLKRMGRDNMLIRNISQIAKQHPKRVVFAEGGTLNILKAALLAKDEGVCTPILLGNRKKIMQLIKEYNLELEDVEIIDVLEDKTQPLRDKFTELLFEKRQRKGLNKREAERLMELRNYFAAMMVEYGYADAAISGVTRKYKDVIKPGIQIIGRQRGVNKIAGMYILLTNKGPMFFADTTMNIAPSAKELAEIAILVSDTIKQFNITPRVAMLSFSNFGSSEEEYAKQMSIATEIVKKARPNLIIDGEIQANFALNSELTKENFPFSLLAEKSANCLIFPNLSAGNIAYKLLQEMLQVEVIGPILLGMDKSYHVLQLGSSVREIHNMIRIAVMDAHYKKEMFND
jgi:malate dehydrogenase (oxaloacetate-decarboxylating)(NADP+)